MSLRRSAAEIAAVVFTVAVMVIGVVMVMLAGSGVAAAQDGGNVSQQPGEYIDADTTLVSTELDRDGMVTVVIHSTEVQTIEIYDPAGYWTEGEPAHRSVRVYPGERVNVTLQLEELRRQYGVVIETDDKIYPKILREPTQTLAFIRALSGGEALATGALAAFGSFVISGVYVLWIEGGEPEVA